MEGYCSSCKIRFEGKRCPNPNCTLHGVAVQMQHAEEQRIDPDTRQALNNHYRDCAEKEAQERRVEQQLLQDAGIMHTTTQAPFPAHVLVVGGCFGFVLAMLLVATWFSFSASTEPTVVHAPSPGFYPPTQGQFRPAPVVRRNASTLEGYNCPKMIADARKKHIGGTVQIIGCEKKGVELPELPAKKGQILIHNEGGIYRSGAWAKAYARTDKPCGGKCTFPKAPENSIVVTIGGKYIKYFKRPKKGKFWFTIENTSNYPVKPRLHFNAIWKRGDGIMDGKLYWLVLTVANTFDVKDASKIEEARLK